MKITELPPFNPRLEEYRAEEFLAQSISLLEYPIEQDQAALDAAPFEVKPPPPPPEPPIPLLPHVWYPKPTQGVIQATPKLLSASRPLLFVGKAAKANAERVMRPLLSGQGPITVRGESGVGKTTLLQYVATHERTRQRFRKIWYFDNPNRVGQLGAIQLGLSNVLAEVDPYKQLGLLAGELNDDTLLVIDNLSEDHPLFMACQTISPFVLLGVRTPREELEEDDHGKLIIPEDPAGYVTLRRWSPEDSVDLLSQMADLVDARNGISREVRPLLEEICVFLGFHPLGIAIIGSMMVEDDITPPEMLDYMRKLVASTDLEVGAGVALRICIDTLPAEYRRLLEAFGVFSPLGVQIGAIQTVAGIKNELALQRGLTALKRRNLIYPDERLKESYFAAGLVYQWASANNPHEPGKKHGEHARQWIVDFLRHYAYEPATIFTYENQLRYAYQIIEEYRLLDFAGKLSPTLSDYLRTYIPALLPHDAPPPRLIGDRAQAVQLARHGLELAESGEIQQGREALQTAINDLKTHGSTHDRAEAIVRLARLEDLDEEYERAITLLETAAKLVFDLDAMESVSIVRLGLAMAYRRNDRYRDALGVLDDRPEADAERARIYRAMGNLDAMLKALSKSGDMTPYAKAESYLQAGRYAEALSAIAGDNTPQSHYLRALIYHLQKDYEHALLGYRQAVDMYAASNPERAIPLRAIATIHAVEGHYDEAETVLTEVLEQLKPLGNMLETGRTLGLLAAIHLKQGNNRTAAETASQALEKLGGHHNDSANASRILGRASWRLERYEQALNAFEQETEHVQSEFPRSETRIGIAFFHLAECYRKTEQLDRAVTYHRRALTHIKPDVRPKAYFMIQSALFRVLVEAGRLKDAIEINETAIAHLDHHPPPDLQHLGYMLCMSVRIHQQQGQNSQAYKSFARWLNTLSGRADALTDETRPQLALLALTLAARSLLASGRGKEALPLAEEATTIAEAHIKDSEQMPIAWAARRDYGEALIDEKEWATACEVYRPLLIEDVKAEIYTSSTAYEGMGIALQELGDYRQALEHFWVALDLQPVTHKQGLLFERVANCHLALGEISRAVENFNEAIKLVDRKTYPGVAARILTTMAHTLAGVNRYADAIGVYKDALEMLREVPDASPLHTARVFASLGRSNEIQGQLRDATQAYRNALETLEKNHVAAPDDYRDILLRLARVLVAQQSYDVAIPYFEQARDQAHDWGTQQEVGNITRELAEAERDGGYLSKCLQTYEDGLELLSAENFPKDRAAILRSYGQALAQTQQFEQARHAWGEALSISKDDDPLEIALTHYSIGQAFRAQQDYNAAEQAFREALQFQPKGTVQTAATHRELGETLLEANRYDDALQPLSTALEIERALPQQSNARLVKTLQLLATVEENRGNRQTAITHYHASLVYMDRGFQPQRYAETLRKLGQLYAEGHAWDECQKALGEALEIELAMKPRADDRLAENLRMIADAYREEGHLEKAANAYKRMATYANLTQEDASKLRETLNDIERHTATLNAALESLMVLEGTGAEPKSFAFVYALIVRMYYLLSDMENSRTMMDRLVKYLNANADTFNIEDERPDYRSLAHLRLAFAYEKQGELAHARDHYRLALKDNSDNAVKWLIEQSMQAVM